jgi:hypothetical protein
MATRKKLIDPKKVKRGELAEIFGVTVRTISNWKNDGLPSHRDSTYDLRTAIEWRFDLLATTNSSPEQASPALERYRELRCAVLQSELDEREGRLVDWPTIRAGWCHRVSIVTQALEALVNRLPPMLEGCDRHEMRRVLVDELNHLRCSFAKEGKYCPPVEVDGEIEYLRPEPRRIGP